MECTYLASFFFSTCAQLPMCSSPSLSKFGLLWALRFQQAINLSVLRNTLEVWFDRMRRAQPKQWKGDPHFLCISISISMKYLDALVPSFTLLLLVPLDPVISRVPGTARPLSRIRTNSNYYDTSVHSFITEVSLLFMTQKKTNFLFSPCFPWPSWSPWSSLVKAI